jgi:hypothetical protein
MLVLVAALLFLVGFVLRWAHAGYWELCMLAGLFFMALGISLGSTLAVVPWRRTPPAV